ncbi:hypothetical protein [Marinoscillum sp. MHG1-6]|uniref:hypothetical protein n=1 Tax=Marinoscillum sp. MHG1-6 TaxID=2959627 RepID=UPI002157EFAE|nr:hypothetical protein [Marinoscillum sp. MHG1-6]
MKSARDSKLKMSHGSEVDCVDWKKLERKRKNLIRLGVPQGQAYAWSRTRMGGWAVAQSPILITTITLSGLRRKGCQSMLDHYSKTQPRIQ